MADPEVQKAIDEERFRKTNHFLEQRESLRASRGLCEEMRHESVGCNCFEYIAFEVPPAMSGYSLVQPDARFDKNSEQMVATVFVRSTYEPEEPPPKKRKYTRRVENSDPLRPRRAYAQGPKRGDAETRRDIKKKLFMDLGIVRTNCGIDAEEQNRENAMKRKVTETIVTTYCELCEQNFSSSKMLLLHRNKVHHSSTLECHLCMKRFDQTINFNRHMKTHYGPNAQFDVACEFCERKFKDKDSLKIHIRVSHKE